VTGLLSLRGAAPLLGCKDARTARKRLAALGVPVVSFGGRRYVDRGDIARALRAHARPLGSAGAAVHAGVTLAPGRRLWDSPHEVSPRRV
jgi:hypothetical protein